MVDGMKVDILFRRKEDIHIHIHTTYNTEEWKKTPAARVDILLILLIGGYTYKYWSGVGNCYF